MGRGLERWWLSENETWLLTFPIYTYFQLFNNKIIRYSFYFFHFYSNDNFLGGYNFNIGYTNNFVLIIVIIFNYTVIFIKKYHIHLKCINVH